MSESAAPAQPPVKVLLVEDSASDALLVRQVLADARDPSYVITRMERLSEAVERCRLEEFDVALLDLGLPDGDGIETVVRFRAAVSGVPVVILTGLDDEEMALRAVQAGAQDYLAKGLLDSRLVTRAIRYAIERRRADEMLRSSEEQYRLFFECSPQPMWAVDRHTFRFLAVNDAALHQYGYTREEFLSMTTMEIRVHAQDDPRGGAPGDTDSDSDTRRHPGPYRHRRKDGTCLWVEASSRGFLLRGRPAWLTTVQDVTEKVSIEEARRETEHRFRTLFESDIIGSLVASIEGRILEANDFFLRMVGASRADLEAGKLRWDELTPPEYRSLDEAVVRQLLGGGHPKPWEKEFLRADGSRVPVLLGVAPLHKAEGTTVAYAVDLTEKKRLEEQFRQAQKMEAIGKLAGGVAHDFNNLLTVIDGYARILVDSLPADDGRDMAEEILRAGERAAALTRQLLAFSRKQVLELRGLDLNAVIADMGRMVRRLLGEDIELVTIFGPALARVRADPGQLEQVLLNLAVNARDAMPHGGRLTIETANTVVGERAASFEIAPGPCVVLTVSDTGIGMDAAVRQHVFEPFFTTKPAGVGTGLGLATVYGIVKQSGGHVIVESEPGRGTSFVIFLPRAAGERDAEPAPEPPPAPDARARETVLLVEDDAPVRRLARAILEKRDYLVLAAAGPEEALELAARQPGRIDVLLSDVILPRLSGPELGERVKALRPGIRVVYMSGYPDHAAARIPAGDAFLPKPFTPEDLARSVREALIG